MLVHFIFEYTIIASPAGDGEGTKLLLREARWRGAAVPSQMISL
jgi:hypothetical protein